MLDVVSSEFEKFQGIHVILGRLGYVPVERLVSVGILQGEKGILYNTALLSTEDSGNQVYFDAMEEQVVGLTEGFKFMRVIVEGGIVDAE